MTPLFYMEEIKKHYKINHIFNIRDDGFTDLFIFQENTLFDGTYFKIDNETDYIYISGKPSDEDIDFIKNIFPNAIFVYKLSRFTNRFVLINRGAYNHSISEDNIHKEQFRKRKNTIFEIVNEADKFIILWDEETKSTLKMNKNDIIKNKKFKNETYLLKKEEYSSLKNEAIKKGLITKETKLSTLELKRLLNYTE